MAAKKLTVKEAFAFLKTLGVDAEHVAEEKDSDMSVKSDDATYVPLTTDDLILMVDDSRKPIIESKVKAELNASTHTAVTAKVYGGLRKQLVEEGVPAVELEGKTEKEMAKIARLHFSKNSDLDAQAINQRMADMIEAHKTEKNTLESTWKDKYTQLESSLTRKQIIDNLKAVYKEAKGINPAANVDILAEDFLNDLERNTNVKLGADGKSIELYNKTDNSRIMNTAGTNFAGVSDRLKQFHEPRGQWNEDNRHIKPADVMKDRLNLDTTVNKDGVKETAASKQVQSVEEWANATA